MLAILNGPQQSTDVVALERWLAGQQVIERRAQAVDIAARAELRTYPGPPGSARWRSEKGCSGAALWGSSWYQ